MPRRAFTVAVILALAGLAACGDSAPSKEDFLAKADPVCARGNAIATVFTTPSDLPMIKDFATKLADNADKTAAEVEKLDFPGGDDGKAAKDMVKSLRDAGVAARAVIPDVDASNYPNVETGVTKMVDAFKAADGKARTFGSKECGKGEAEAVGKLGITANATVKNAYIAKADALCEAADKQIDALPEPDSPAEAKESIDKSGVILDKMLADIIAIPKPHTDSTKLTEYISSTERFIAKFKEGGAIAVSANERKFEQWVEELSELGDAADAKADAFGFKGCGSQGA